MCVGELSQYEEGEGAECPHREPSSAYREGDGNHEQNCPKGVTGIVKRSCNAAENRIRARAHLR